ncbi:TPA: hypothetical protein HA265_03725 [Candidatus Woesearchaeota archaeon]|nr:hypothetical protein [Candidatus Woesearchaeota archaeon]
MKMKYLSTIVMAAALTATTPVYADDISRHYYNNACNPVPQQGDYSKLECSVNHHSTSNYGSKYGRAKRFLKKLWRRSGYRRNFRD